jgi:hypothetical protein
MIAAQAVMLSLDGRSVSIASDGLRPFKVTPAATVANATGKP